MEEKRKKYDIGVIIGRFQIDELHSEHKKMIREVLERHNKTILFLGVSPSIGTERNPMDFLTRKLMIEEEFGNSFSVILPLNDKKLDEVWSKQVDSKIKEVFPLGSAVLYGSKDSFIPHYKGRHNTIELETEVIISAKDIREAVSKRVLPTKDFRSGIIYNTYNRYPIVHPTIDVAILNDNETQVLLGRKHDEVQFRFIGGFVDVEDEALEQTVRRETGEETGVEIDGITYIGSTKVRDWRYRSDPDRSIMTVFYKAKKISGHEKGADDIAEVKWFNVESLKENDIVPEHAKLLTLLKKSIKL
jgi:bifunctional NMN adenylyltransferase/nudix hydrolase